MTCGRILNVQTWPDLSGGMWSDPRAAWLRQDDFMPLAEVFLPRRRREKRSLGPAGQGVFVFKFAGHPFAAITGEFFFPERRA